MDGKVMDKEAVSVMILFDNLSNNFNSADKVGFVRILYFSTNIESMKQCVDVEFMRVWKVGF